MTIRNGVKIVVFNVTGQVLLLKRTDSDDRRPSEWDIPGGGVDPGEDFGQAAVRELAEETGLITQVNNLRAVYTNTMLYETGDVSANRMLFVWRCEHPQVVLSEEHNEMKWVSVEQVLQDFPHPIYNAGIAYAQQHGLLDL